MSREVEELRQRVERLEAVLGSLPAPLAPARGVAPRATVEILGRDPRRRAHGAPPEHVRAPSDVAAWNVGYAAGIHGGQPRDNPYAHDDRRHDLWAEALKEGFLKRAARAHRRRRVEGRALSRLETAEANGHDAARLGVQRDANPYTRGRGSAAYFNAWDRGWIRWHGEP